MHAKSAPTNITRSRLTLPPPPRLRGGKMTPRAAGRAAPAIKIAILTLLLAAAAALAGIPTAGEVAAQGRNYASGENPNLIDITTLAQLDAIRYDLNGNGMQDAVSDENWAKYQAAFRNARDGMGCVPSCQGYELLNNLDFDENGDGALGPLYDPTYWNEGKGWHPIGAPPDFNANMQYCQNTNNIAAYCYSAPGGFDGNGYTISNLYINRTITVNFTPLNFLHVGLFGATTTKFRDVGLVNPYISITRSGTTGDTNNENYTNVGALLGFAFGSNAGIISSWVDGGGITFTMIGDRDDVSRVNVGCLLGRMISGPDVISSGATCAVKISSTLDPLAATNDLDTNQADAGGLLGSAGFGSNHNITASYARGNVTCHGTGTKACGGLVGHHVSGSIFSSYATGNVVNQASAANLNQYGTMGTGGLVGRLQGSSPNNRVIHSYATGRITAALAGRSGPSGVAYVVDGLIGGRGATGEEPAVTASYWDRETTGITAGSESAAYRGTQQTSMALKTPTEYGSAGIYATWDDRDLDDPADGNNDAPWDFGTSADYPILTWGHGDAESRLMVLQRAPQPTATEYVPSYDERFIAPEVEEEEPDEYVAPPIVYNLNIRFNVKGLTLDEGESATYRVRMSQPPVGHPARVAITSNNPDVVVAPTEVTFSSANYNQWQTVKVTTLRDPNDTDESATLAHRGPSLSYGSILVTVNDTWPGAATETVNGHTVTVRHTLNAPYGVTVTAPATLDANTHITIAAPPPGTPQGAPGYGLGQSAAARMLTDIRVQGTPTDGLTICLPAPEPLVTEAGEHPLTLLRYAAGVWTPVAGAEQQDGDDGAATLCAAGITEYGTFAAAYTLPALGAVSDLTASPGEAPGSITLTWTPGANAERHWLAGVKQSDLSDFAVWAAADAMGSHTVSNLEPGATYIFTVTAGRGEGDTRQWSAWAPWATATAPAPTPTPTPAIKAPPSPLPQ